MIKLTESLRQFLMKYHRNDLALIQLGHVEILEPYVGDYLEWLKTEEGASYLEGGKNYKLPR